MNIRTACRRVACGFAFVALICGMASVIVADPDAKAESVWAVMALISLMVMVVFIAAPDDHD